MSRPAEEVRALLAARTLPGSERTWLELAADQAKAEGATMDDVLAWRRLPQAARARRFAWWFLHDVGFSLPSIAEGWGAGDHTTILAGVRLAAAEMGVVETPKRPGLRRTHEKTKKAAAA